jgi:hypothetical protein
MGPSGLPRMALPPLNPQDDTEGIDSVPEPLSGVVASVVLAMLSFATISTFLSKRHCTETPGAFSFVY